MNKEQKIIEKILDLIYKSKSISHEDKIQIYSILQKVVIKMKISYT